MNDFYIYIYKDPVNHTPFYVGKGHGRRKKYIDNHYHGWCGNKIKSLIEKGLNPEVIIYAENLEEIKAFYLEKMLIAQYGRRDIGTGCLCNNTDGGEGVSGRKASEEENRRNSERNKGKKQSPETIKKRTQGQWGRKLSFEAIRKRTEKQKGRVVSEETRKKLSKAALGRRLSVESIRKRSESVRGRKNTEETIKKMSEARRLYRREKKSCLTLYRSE